MPNKIDERIALMCDQLYPKLKERNAPIIAVSIIRDEQDILERFVRHTLNCVDGLLIVNHRSCDASRHILESLYKEGLPLCFLDADELGNHQSAWLTSLAAAAAIFLSARVVIPLDADEFLQRSDGGDVREYISTLSCNNVRFISWRAYIPLENDPDNEPDVLRRITHRLVTSPRIQKVVVGGQIAAHESFRLGFGSHEVIVGLEKIDCLSDECLALAHFPVRSVLQFVAKVVVARLTIPLVPERPPDAGIHYEWIRNSTQISLSMSPTDLRRAATLYGTSYDSFDEALVFDPVTTSDAVLQYSDGRPGDPIARVERVARDLAAPLTDTLNVASVGHFVEAKIVSENKQMRSTLHAINTIFGLNHNLNNPKEIISMAAQCQAELTSVHASLLWRAFAPYRKLRELMKGHSQRRRPHDALTIGDGQQAKQAGGNATKRLR
jgi:hypothetical protein